MTASFPFFCKSCVHPGFLICRTFKAILKIIFFIKFFLNIRIIFEKKMIWVTCIIKYNHIYFFNIFLCRAKLKSVEKPLYNSPFHR